MGKILRGARQLSLLWLSGFKEACCLHRVIFFCASSKMLLIRTGQCFLLNGFIFLGSLFIVRSLVIPILTWILPDLCNHFESQYDNDCDYKGVMTLYSVLRSFLVEVFYVLWFYPLYVFSFILSALWYNDIAKYAFEVIKNRNKSSENSSDETEKPEGVEGLATGIAEQVYSILLLTIFFIEVFVTGYVPYVGKAMNFLLLSWMYSYYCFEYKWNYTGVGLNWRLDLFESNWAFFAGFGSPCVIPIFFFSPLVSYGVMAILYPLFVLTAAGTEVEKVINSVRNKEEGSKIPIFYIAQRISTMVLNLFPEIQKEN
ncbi:hypothetical protein LUZ60_004240 [Juncus effusus]|nr:hypothetical protein LUZ60_004240 [Juncus effusus]